MSTIWKPATKTNNNSFTGTTLSRCSRQQKLASIACLAILGILLAIGACSKQSAKPAPSSTSSSASTSSGAKPAETAQPSTAQAPPPQTPAKKKAAKKRPAEVTYRDPITGVSFVYPRKFELLTGDKAQPRLDADATPMNFVEPGGVAVATVALPSTLYPGTDFASGFFAVNVNRSLSEQECRHFAFVDTSDADGEPIDAEKVTVGSADMEMTSEFSGNATRQEEARYYHSYENGACYEFVLGLGTAGYGVKNGIEPVDRDQVFARLQKILASVKVSTAGQEQVAEQTSVTPDSTSKQPSQ